MNQSIKKRNRENESSSRQVQCYYCNATKAFKDLESHCKNAHNKPAPLKGQLTLAESFFKPAKRAKVDTPEPEATREPEATSQKPDESPEPEATESNGLNVISLIKQLTGMLFTLTTLLNPLGPIVRSLERSSNRIEESLTTKLYCV